MDMTYCFHVEKYGKSHFGKYCWVLKKMCLRKNTFDYGKQDIYIMGMHAYTHTHTHTHTCMHIHAHVH